MTGGIVILKVKWVHNVKLPKLRMSTVIHNGALGLVVVSTRKIY